MRLKPPLENSKLGYVSSLLKERPLSTATHGEKDMANCRPTPQSDLCKNLKRISDPTLYDMYEPSFCFKESFVNEELPETSSSISEEAQSILCGPSDSEWNWDVLSDVVEDIYFEDDYLQDYYQPIFYQPILSPQSTVKCGNRCIDNSNYYTDHFVIYEDFIAYDKCEDAYLQDSICQPWPVFSPPLNLQPRKHSINSFQDIQENNLCTKEITKEPCTIKQSCRRKHHSAPDILCHDKYNLSCYQETQTQCDASIEQILSGSLSGLQIAFDCSLMDSSICNEDICKTVCLLQSDTEMCTDGQCRGYVQHISDALSSNQSDSELELLSDEHCVLHQHKYKRKLENFSALAFISSSGLDQNNCITTDLVDNEIQLSFQQKVASSSLSKIEPCNKSTKQCDVFISSNDTCTEHLLPVLQNHVPLTSKGFHAKESGLVSLPGNYCSVNFTINLESPLDGCKLITADRVRWLHQRLYILYVHLIVALLVPIIADFHSTSNVKYILLTVTIVQPVQYTLLTKGHFMSPNKKHHRKKSIYPVQLTDI